MNEKPNRLKRFFGLFNTLRKIIVNLVFFTVLIIFVIIFSVKDTNEIVVPKNTSLVLNLYGDVVEQKFPVDPLDALVNEAFNQKEERPEVLLSDIIDVIEHAKTDENVKVLVLKLQGMGRAGLTKLRIIGEAIDAFKTSGKSVIALGDQFTQDQYYLASYADEIWLNPNGWLLLDGYGRYQLYFKSAFDKLAISQHIFRVGTYKSAVEPYMRDDMSPEAKEANREWLNDLWQIYKADVAKLRKIKVSNFDEDITTLIAKLEKAEGKIAQYALENGWVDHLKTREQMDEELKSRLSSNKLTSISFKDYLKTIKPAFQYTDPTTDKVAIIVAKGTILNGDQDAGTIGGDSTAKLLKQARKNSQVKAVVLRVDSPGGSAYASDIIRQEVELLKQAGKPVVASMGTYAASGGYWISAPADKIFASPTTITGSIGIFGFFATFENTLSKLGIHTDGVGTTDIAGLGVTRPLSDDVKKIFQIGIERGYKDFLTLVAENRNMSLEQVDQIAQGRVWSGKRAKELGLVDELGNLKEAVAEAAQLANLGQYDTLLIEKKLSPADMFLENLTSEASTWLPERVPSEKGPLASFISIIAKELSVIEQFNDPQGMYAFCEFCELN